MRRIASVGYSLGICLLLLAAQQQAAAATVYHCRAYAGGEFFSSRHCGSQSAVILGAYNVPSTMPFNQQVDIAKQQIQQNSGVTQREIASTEKRTQCATVNEELLRLTKKYESGDYVPVSEVNVDQALQRKLKADASRLRC